MLLTILKIITTTISAALAVFAVTTDFTDHKTHRLKPAGKWYVGFFLLSVGLSYFLDKLSDNEKQAALNKSFQNSINTITNSTQTLLTKTQNNLKGQFRQLDSLNGAIDKNLRLTKDNLQIQFRNENKNQEAIRSLALNIKGKTEKNIKKVTDLVDSISRIAKLEASIQRITEGSKHPLDLKHISLKFDIYWNVHQNDINRYAERLIDFAHKEIASGTLDLAGLDPSLDSVYRKRYDSLGMVISYKLHNDNSKSLYSIFVLNGSKAMPDCSNVTENAAARLVSFQNLEFTFIKNYDPTRYLAGEYLKFTVFTENNRPGCDFDGMPGEQAVEGASKTSFLIQMNKNGGLGSFRGSYETNKIKLDTNSYGIVNADQLIDYYVHIKNALNYPGEIECPLQQFNNIRIHLWGNENGGLLIKKIGKVSGNGSYINVVYQLKKESFDYLRNTNE